MGEEPDERDFYWALLNLGQVSDLERLLEQSLQLILRVVGAQRGFIEVRQPGVECVWSRSTALATHELDAVRHTLSQGIIAEALASGETVRTASAMADPRFSSRASVQQNQIEAAVCAPIGATPAVGVVYLQGRMEPGPFPSADVDRVELFARHLTPYADRLLVREQTRVDPTARYRRLLHCEGLVGRSAALAEMLRQLSMVASLDLAVLLLGPTGAGKSEVARVLHASSGRKGAFVELNCAALPAELLESELFGAERGAHSTATTKVMGKVEAARGGTLFLDEVAELPMASQAKLLHLLQSGRYYSLGSVDEKRSDARIVAATNVDLAAAVEAKTFRSDLYYRLNVYTIPIPGLDQRPEDVLPMAEHFLALAAERYGFPPMYLLPGARHRLASMRFPGHVRELMHTVERAAVRASGDGTLEVGARHLGEARVEAAAPAVRTYQEHLAAFQRNLLEVTLEEVGGNVSAAARRLDLTRSHFYSLMRLHGVRPRRRGAAGDE
jgi:Nif-specific regulatory protein